MTAPSAPRLRKPPLVLIVGAAIVAAAVIAAVVIASNSSGGGKYDVVDGTVTVELATIEPYGEVLVTNQGYALYMFPPDEQREVACTGECAVNWPPLFLQEGTTLTAGDGVDAELLGTVTAPDGQSVASYDGWPLYGYLGDISPFTATGQGQYLDGGYWYLLRADGELVTPNAAG